MTSLRELNPDFRDLLLAFSAAGVEFVAVGAHALAGRESIDLEGSTVCFLGREELVRNEEATGRPKDLADVARLRR